MERKTVDVPYSVNSCILCVLHLCNNRRAFFFKSLVLTARTKIFHVLNTLATFTVTLTQNSIVYLEKNNEFVWKSIKSIIFNTAGKNVAKYINIYDRVRVFFQDKT